MSHTGLVSEHQHKQILVVDDDPAVRAMLVRVLIDDGYRAVPAAGGEDALRIAETFRFDLVVLDLGMPDKDGWETFAALAHEHPGLAVIIITAKPNQRLTAEAVGAGAFFEKPLVFPELLHAVERLVA